MLTSLMALSLMMTGFDQVPVSDSVTARAGRVAARYPDTTAARADGYGPLRVGRIADLTPFQGQHWLHRWWVFGGSPDLDTPSFVMFVPVDGAWRPAGIAYSQRVAASGAAPADLGGVAAPWHLHQPCAVVPGEGAALADGAEDCLARGGVPRPPAIAMVHAWTVPNPEGPFAHDNVALPYWVCGLAQPRTGDLATPARARRARALGLALGETYGAILPYARLVEATSTLPGLADSLAVRRRAITALVPQLRRAERARDRPGFDRLADRAIREWEALRRLYAAAAPSPEIEAQLERQHDRALGKAPGHHMH
jgi:hypothetical protein